MFQVFLDEVSAWFGGILTGQTRTSVSVRYTKHQPGRIKRKRFQNGATNKPFVLFAFPPTEIGGDEHQRFFIFCRLKGEACERQWTMNSFRDIVLCRAPVPRINSNRRRDVCARRTDQA